MRFDGPPPHTATRAAAGRGEAAIAAFFPPRRGSTIPRRRPRVTPPAPGASARRSRRLAMKLLLPLFLAASLAAPAPSVPECTTTLELPDAALELSLRWRQIGRDLAPYLEPQGQTALDLKALRVRSLLSQGLQLRSDVSLRAGDVTLPPGT